MHTTIRTPALHRPSNSSSIAAESPSVNMPTDSSRLRQALGCFATGVTVITALDGNGNPVGLTCNSFNSVSMSPPLILWSLRRESRSLKVFSESRYFAVNILTDQQIHISQHFAKAKTDKFLNIDYSQGLGGAPILPESAVTLECEREHLYEGGDHLIIVGRVLKFNHHCRSPLVFQNGKYARALPITLS